MGDPLFDYLEASLPSYLTDLAELVGQDSGTDNKAGVDAVTGWLEKRLAALGFDIKRIAQARRGDDLLARVHGRGRARILLLGHADTVYGEGVAARRPLLIDGELIRGPGVCDMKGGLLSGIYALEALRQIGWESFGTISFLIVSDEEGSERHSIPLIVDEGARHDVVLTLEAARENGDIVSARKATRWLSVQAHGRSAHTGVEPEKGRNAVLALARFIAHADGLNDHEAGDSVNVGVFAGGQTPNVVPDRASARFDLRAWTNRDLDDLEQRFRALAAREVIPGVAFEVEVEPGSDCPAMERTDAVASLEARAIDLARSLGIELRAAATGGASDISFAMSSGIPGLDGLGPVGGLDHSPDEYILSSSIVPRAVLLAKLIQQLGEGGGDDERGHE